MNENTTEKLRNSLLEEKVSDVLVLRALDKLKEPYDQGEGADPNYSPDYLLDGSCIIPSEWIDLGH